MSTSRRPAEATANLGSRGGAAEVRLAESSSWSSVLAPRCQHVPMNWMWMGGEEHGKVRRFSYQPKQPGKNSLFSSGGCCGRGGFGALYLFPGPAVTKHCRLETAGMHSLTIQTSGSLKSRGGLGHTPSFWRLQGRTLLAFSSCWWLQVSLACGHIALISELYFPGLPPLPSPPPTLFLSWVQAPPSILLGLLRAWK